MISLAVRHMKYRWGQTLMLSACVMVMIGLPLVSRSVVSSFERSLVDRAETVPMLVGAAGSRFDLVLAGLHWRKTDVRSIQLGTVEEIRSEPGVMAIPVHVRFEARGIPIAAVPYEYFEFRQLVPRDGRFVAGLGEAVLGASAASKLNVKSGDELLSDQLRSYDITAPPAVKLRVVGVLHEKDTADDHAVFVDLETAWLLEGLSHGHKEASAINDDQLIIGKSKDRVALSGAVIEYQRVDDSTVDSFHLHAERDQLPITAVLVFPGSEKTAAIVRTRVNANASMQALSPSVISQELMDSVLQVRRVVDAISILVGGAMLGLLILIGSLSYRSRSEEVRTLLEIGATKQQVVVLFGIEFGGVLILGIVGALIAVWLSSGESMFLLSLVSN